MYAVVNTGGKQYKVQKGDTFRFEKLPGEVGSPVTFDKVLMFSDGDTVRIGQPLLDDTTVKGHIVEQGKSKKIIVFKYKRRKRYRRKQGHRQLYTAVMIDAIEAPGVAAEPEEPVAAQSVEATPAVSEESKPEVTEAEAPETAEEKPASEGPEGQEA